MEGDEGQRAIGIEVVDRRRTSGSPRPSVAGVARAVLAVLFAVLLATLLVRQGSVDRVAFEANALFAFVLLSLAILVCGEPTGARAAFRTGLAVLLMLLSWIGLQAVATTGHPLAAAPWAAVDALFGDGPAAISIQPSAAVHAAIAFALPFVVFLAALALFNTDERATLLARIVGRGGGLLAAGSLAAFQVAPEWQGGPPENLTSVFVNRNTAATLFGVAGLLLSALAVEGAREFPWHRFRAWFWNPAGHRRPALPLAFILDGALAALCFAAVFLTLSRGGAGATLVALSVFVTGLVVAPPMRRSRKASERAGVGVIVRRTAGIAAGLAVVASIALLFAGRVIRRSGMQGVEDERFCILPGLWAAAEDAFPWGTGAGTFRDAFAPYRDPACSVEGVWYRAHNDWMEGLITLGLPFAVLALVAVSVLVVIFVRGVRSRRSRRTMPLAGLSVLVLVAVHALVDFSLQIPAVAAITAAALAVAVTIATGRSAAPVA